MPFCSESTRVPSAAPRSASAAVRVWCDFVVTTARSYGPAPAGRARSPAPPTGDRPPRARPPPRGSGGHRDAVPAPPSSPRARRGPAAPRSTSRRLRRPSRGLMPAEPTSPGGRLLVEEDGPALILRISNPGRANALDEPILDALASLLHAPPPAARAVLLAGEGDRHFSAGLDLAVPGPSRPAACATASGDSGPPPRRSPTARCPSSASSTAPPWAARSSSRSPATGASPAPAPGWRCRPRGSASSTPQGLRRFVAAMGPAGRAASSSPGSRSRPRRPWRWGWWSRWSSRRPLDRRARGGRRGRRGGAAGARRHARGRARAVRRLAAGGRRGSPAAGASGRSRRTTSPRAWRPSASGAPRFRAR